MAEYTPRKTHIGGFILVIAAVLIFELMGGTAGEVDKQNGSTELATLGGGCFWCLEAAFEGLPGVRSVVSGYAGGHKPNPTYKEVCSGNTGHAEVVQIEFVPSIIRYEELLDLFWDAHDPTSLNRQGDDVGTQYRSIILYHSLAQRDVAAKSIAAVEKRLGRRVVTELKPFTVFYPAEKYHQDFYRNNPDHPYCRVVVGPKLEKLRAKIDAICRTVTSR